MPIPHSFQQEPDRADPPMRSIWFGMRCDYTRAALEGAMASGDAPAPVVIVLPAAPRSKTSAWPEPPFDRWIHSLGATIVEIADGQKRDWRPVLKAIEAHQSSVGIVACFPYKVPREIRRVLPPGVINIHPSLLPALRGPEPVFHAYRLGFDVTGVSLHLLEDGWDTGPVLRQQAVQIPERGDARAFEASLARRGGELLGETIAEWQAGAITPQPRDDTRASWAPAPDASDLVIPAELTVRKAIRMVRAVGDAFGPLVVPEAGTGELVRVAGVIEDQRDEPVAGRDLAGMVRAQFADGTAWFWRNTARKD